MVQDLIAALAAHALPPDLFAAVTSALVLGDQALRQVEKAREMAAERQRRKRAADAEARHVTSREASLTERSPQAPLRDKITTQKKGEARPLPIDWSPIGGDLAFAEAAGLDVEATAKRFREYWHGRDRVRTDWSATWRYHCNEYGQRSRPMERVIPTQEPSRMPEPQRATPGNPYLAEARKFREHLLARETMGAAA